MSDGFIDYVFYRMYYEIDYTNPLLMFYHSELPDNIQEMIFNVLYKKDYEILVSIQIKFRKKLQIRRNKAARIIQKGCHNWLYAPICKDGTIGINCRLGWAFLFNIR